MEDRLPAYRVTGGAGSVLVEFDALEHQAALLEQAAGRMNVIAAGLLRIQLEDDGLAWMQPPVSAAVAAEELSRASFHLGRGSGMADDAAAGLRAAAARYRDAEGRLERLYPAPGFLSLSLLLAGRRAGGFPGRAAVESLPLRFFDTGSLKGIVAALSPGSRGLREITVEKSARSGGKVPLAASAAGLLNRSAVLLEENDPGMVEVLRIEREGGRVFIVTVPGTQPGGRTAGPNPFDNYGNAEGRAYESRFIAAAVAEALRQAKAEAGDAVILVGYSQGGIHAANSAGHIQDATGVEVRYVLTAGAPAGDALIPAQTHALHLEHQQDWVAGTDGTSNPDAPNRVTMTLEQPAGSGAGGDAGLGPAHKLPVYLDGAAAADASGDPSLRASLAGMGAVVGAGSVATRELYRFRRVEPRAAAKVVPGLPRVQVPRLAAAVVPRTLPPVGPATVPGPRPAPLGPDPIPSVGKVRPFAPRRGPAPGQPMPLPPHEPP